ncbi:MAG: hypothetical protein J6Q82_06245 [Clostridia bacterium]|nr:hypothetical protein [Clostridia bacterium]
MTLNLRFDFKKILLCIGIFTIIVNEVSFVMIKTTSGTTRLLVDGVATLFVLISTGVKSVRSRDMLALGALLFIPIISMAFTMNVKQSTIFILLISFAWLVSISVKEQDFWIMFRKIMVFLAVFSLAIYIVYLIAPILIQRMPVAVMNQNYTAYNAFFAVIVDTGSTLRNFGIFFEPGAYSIFLLVALFFEFLYFETNIKYVILYIITLLTTYSTLGISVMLILFVIVLFRSNRVQKQSLKWMIAAVLICGGIYLATSGEYFLYQVFGKITNMNESATVRLNSISIPFEEFMGSPIWGIGLNNFLIMLEERCNGIATFTFINCFTIYGLLWGFLPLIGCMKVLVSKVREPLNKVAVLVFAILLFSTESFEQVPFFYLLVFYGWKGERSNCEENNLIRRSRV